MGLFDAPTATTSGNTSTTTSYPEWTQAFNQAVANAGFNMLSPQLQTSPFQVAGLNPDQMKAFDLTRDMTLGAFAGPNQNMQQAMQGLMNASGGNTQAAMMPAAQTGAMDFAQFMNPFQQAVVDTTMRNMQREKNRTSAEIGARAASAGSFGGSREAVQRANLDRNFTDQAGQMVAQLMSQGYDRATAMAQANTALRQSANAANQGALNNMAQFNVGNQIALPALLDRLQTNRQARQTNALQQLLGVGNQQQAFAQTALDTPLRSLERLMGMAPNVYNTTQTGTSARTAPTGAPSAGQQILGFGLNLLKNPLAKLLGG